MNKTASQYRIIDSCKRSSACDASNAIDGNTRTCTKTMDIGPNSENKFTWWYVDLGEIQSVFEIKIQFKDYGQMHGQLKHNF